MNPFHTITALVVFLVLAALLLWAMRDDIRLWRASVRRRRCKELPRPDPLCIVKQDWKTRGQDWYVDGCAR